MILKKTCTEILYVLLKVLIEMLFYQVLQRKLTSLLLIAVISKLD